jgi:hypothetical protein
MKSQVLCFTAAVAALSFVVGGCSTTDSRIKDNQAAFNAAPAEVQAKIRDGKVEVGFTEEQVLMALGKPDRRYTRTTAAGTTDIWAYEDHKPSFSFGIGMAGGGGGTMVGSGVAIGTGDRSGDKLRVIFSGGRVTALETRGRK